MQVCVAIIIYKEFPDKYECQSFEQCLNILNSHDIIIVCPKNLNILLYREIASKFGVIFNVIRFEDINFNSIESYNNLMKSEEFYCKFLNYKFMLIYQLDAFVFKDDLLFWCGKDYEMLGAPWFTDDGDIDNNIFGNGGFSLRKVKTFYDLLSGEYDSFWNINILKCVSSIISAIRKNGIIYGLIVTQNIIKILTSPSFFIKNSPKNEDLLYAFVLRLMKKFKNPTCSDALCFAFERFPSKCFALNGQKIPFGCHAYLKYDFNFFVNRTWIVDLGK